MAVQEKGRVMPETAYFDHIAADIQRARWEQGWTQAQLGNELGVTGTAISYWESGFRRPNAWVVDRLEALFGRRLRP